MFIMARNYSVSVYKKNHFSTGAVGISLESERKSTPITEEDKVPFLLDKILATPAVRRIAIENNVRFKIVFIQKGADKLSFSF